MYVLALRTVYAPTKGWFWCLLNIQINIKITIEWVHHNDAKMRIFTNDTLCRVSLALRSADHVTIDWRWRHNDKTIVTRTLDEWYLTRQISILFTAIFTAGRVRVYIWVDFPNWFTNSMNNMLHSKRLSYMCTGAVVKRHHTAKAQHYWCILSIFHIMHDIWYTVEAAV